MKKSIKIQCPAKINLNLKITEKRNDGFHNIESIMQTINLFDYLTINVSDGLQNEIILNGNSTALPYNEKNLVYKAAKLFLDTLQFENKKIEIFIEKNIPLSAGLAGGSTDAAGTLFGLYKVFCPLSPNHSVKNVEQPQNLLHTLCAQLGSDLNVCLQGGRILAKGRGEIIEQLPFEDFNLSLIKPLKLGISAKEAYEGYNRKILENLVNNSFCNDLEWAVIDKYNELQYLKQKYPQSVMTGSGSTYFMIDGAFEQEAGFWVKNNLHAIDCGVKEI